MFERPLSLTCGRTATFAFSVEVPLGLLQSFRYSMATRAKARRPVVAPEKRAGAGRKAAPVSAGDIANTLASTLTISKAKGARNGAATEHSEAPKSTQDKRVAAMRAVNAASQGLTSVMKSGWKAPRAEPSAKKSTATTHEAFDLAASARTTLGDLRVLSPGDVDVERAAISVAGKLLSLDMVSRLFVFIWVPGLILEVFSCHGRAF